MTLKLKKGEKYLFATDLDGTFLGERNTSLHIKSFEAVKRIKEEGHHFVIATGRSWWWVKMIYDQISSIDATIHFSGAQVYHPHDNSFEEYRSSIKKEIFHKLAKDVDLNKYVEGMTAVGRKHHAYFSKDDDVNQLFFNCYEFIFFLDSRNIDVKKFEKLIRKSIGNNNYIVRVWEYDDHRVEMIISPKGTSKALGLKKLSEYYNIPKENIIYFGDNVNDIEAIEYAGYSYAPSNAKESIKKMVNEVLDLSCSDGAVSKKILDLLGKKNNEKNNFNREQIHKKTI